MPGSPAYRSSASGWRKSPRRNRPGHAETWSAWRRGRRRGWCAPESRGPAPSLSSARWTPWLPLRRRTVWLASFPTLSSGPPQCVARLAAETPCTAGRRARAATRHRRATSGSLRTPFSPPETAPRRIPDSRTSGIRRWDSRACNHRSRNKADIRSKADIRNTRTHIRIRNSGRSLWRNGNGRSNRNSRTASSRMASRSNGGGAQTGQVPSCV